MVGVVVRDTNDGAEPQGSPIGSIPGRVASLEGRMFQVEQGLGDVRGIALAANANAASASLSAKEAADNTRELLAIANASKSAIGFVRKHGPKIISFGCGVMTVAGIGNPELWHYIANFFR